MGYERYDFTFQPGSRHVGLVLVLVLHGKWTGRASQSPEGRELLPNCQQQLACSLSLGPQNCPCMQDRGRYPLLPRNAATGGRNT